MVIRKFFVSVFVVCSFTAYALHEHLIDSAPVSLPPTASDLVPTLSPSLVPDSKRITTPVQQIAPTLTLIPPTDVPFVAPTALPPTPTSQGQYRDGTYTGPETDAYYGLVQVEAIVQQGQIANVKFLDYPHDRRTSQQINSIAMPYLTQEAIQAQSAQVDVISGATLTSQAFAQSLNDALSQARN